MIKKDKKVYPSQLNTKSIACRLPISDYVEIVNDCVKKGISVNDWLLVKLYNKNENNPISVTPESIIKVTIGEEELDAHNDYKFLKNKLLTSLYAVHEFHDLSDNLLNGYTTEEIEEFISFALGQWMLLHSERKKNASFEDVKNQLTILINNGILSSSEKKKYTNDLFKSIDDVKRSVISYNSLMKEMNPDVEFPEVE
jgi:hypothetical protein